MSFTMDSKYSRISKKWVGFVTAIWVQSIAGNNYTFANYSEALKAVTGYDQTQLNNLGVAKDVGKSFGLVAGLLADYLPTWLILLIGAVEGALGYGTQYLVVSKSISPPAFWKMCLVLCMGGNSTTWMNTAVLVTCMRNFPRMRGAVTGTLEGYIGLSTAIFTQLCTALFTSEASSFLLLLTFLPFIVCLTAIVFLTEVPASSSADEDAKESYGFFIVNWTSLALASYLLAITLMEYYLPSNSIQNKLMAFVILVYLIAPLIVPLKLMLCVYNKDKGADGDSNGDTKPLLEEEDTPAPAPAQSSDDVKQLEGGQVLAVEDKAAATVKGATKRGPVLGEDHNLGQALMTLDFWLLFFTFLCGIGTGITAINNLGQIGDAQGFADVSILISLISIWGFFGRIGAGAISEYYVKKAAIPRPVWMAVAQVFLLFGYILFAQAAPGSLYIGSIIVGVCYGVHISITVPTASELFGLKHFGMLYNFLIINIPLGSFFFSGLLARWLYDREAVRGPLLTGACQFATFSNSSSAFSSASAFPGLSGFSTAADFADLRALGTLGGGGDDPPKCCGPHCFGSLFTVMAGMCALGMVLNVILILRIRSLYQDLYGPNGRIERKKQQSSRSR